MLPSFWARRWICTSIATRVEVLLSLSREQLLMIDDVVCCLLFALGGVLGVDYLYYFKQIHISAILLL